MMRAGVAATLGAGVLLACASLPDSSATAALIAVTGRVTVTGSDPGVTLVIVTETEEYELVGDRAEDLWRLQQRYVTVHGRVVRQAYGPGYPARLKVEFYILARDKAT